MVNRLVVFLLGKEHYGVDINMVESIIKPQTITAIPNAPAYMDGVINLRGSVLPVMNLKKRMSVEANHDRPGDRIVVMMVKDIKVGMIVDDVEEVIGIDEGDVEPPPPITSRTDQKFIQGIVRSVDHLILLLDLPALMESNPATVLAY